MRGVSLLGRFVLGLAGGAAVTRQPGAAERLFPWGRRLVTPIGLSLVVLGALALTGLLPITSS